MLWTSLVWDWAARPFYSRGYPAHRFEKSRKMNFICQRDSTWISDVRICTNSRIQAVSDYCYPLKFSFKAIQRSAACRDLSDVNVLDAVSKHKLKNEWNVDLVNPVFVLGALIDSAELDEDLMLLLMTGCAWPCDFHMWLNGCYFKFIFTTFIFLEF